MQDVFPHERRKASIHFGSGFQFHTKLVAGLVHAWKAASGYGSWRHQESFQWEPHTCRIGKGQKPDIIDYFLVSTLIRPLIQKFETVRSVPWGPHCGVKLVLNINFESVVSRQLTGKISKRSRHNTSALQGQNAHRTEEAEGKKPRCQDGQEDTQACSQYASACGFLEEADELGHALERCHDSILGDS